GDDFRSPSVQLSITPYGDVNVLSTHDQILGGHQGQVYLGCTFPADPAYASQIAADARKVGTLLAREGVVGRFAVDFVTVRRGTKWHALAIEINLRKGGTTHPYGTARLLTGGSYDADTARFVMPDGTDRFYMASDNLVHPAWRSLPPAVALDAVQNSPLGYDATARVGVVLHMVTCLPIDGRLGYTAIGRSPQHAAELAEQTEATLHAACAAAS
ncbi:MAG: peptide ligase PGM1-related protein, partial [Frankia sp.]|nr:peptide ligase PGM1-related protein [Frankia sp.]